MCQYHAESELDRMKTLGRIQMQAALLTGALFNDPTKGVEMYQDMMADLADGESASDDDWLTNPDATTDISSLERFLQKKAAEHTDE